MRSKRTIVLAFGFSALREQRFSRRPDGPSKPLQPHEVELSGIEPLSEPLVSTTYPDTYDRLGDGRGLLDSQALTQLMKHDQCVKR